MRKLLALVLVLCLITTVLSVPAFATEEIVPPAEGTVLRITGENRLGSKTVIDEFKNFKDGWNKAMTIAENSRKNGYTRIIVDIYEDWTAVDGEFSNDGDGFSYDAILFPEDVCVTLNLNGHTINRAMTTWEYNGEVMCVEEDANVIINDGTITGGWSANGAGGIHIHDDAYVTLNNVHIVGNIADDDDGGGIAVYDGATLVMNGGSLRDNAIDGSGAFTSNPDSAAKGGAIYTEDSKVVLNNVEIKNNQSRTSYNVGAAIAGYDSDITLTNCIVDGNGIYDEANNVYAAHSIFFLDGCKLQAQNTNFTNNGHFLDYKGFLGFGEHFISSMFYLFDDTTITMDNCTIENNETAIVFNENGGSGYGRLYITDVTIVNNKSCVITAELVCYYSHDSFFRNCTVNNNENIKVGAKSYYDFDNMYLTFTFYDCDLGDSTFDSESEVVFVSTTPEETTPLETLPTATTPISNLENGKFDENEADASALGIDPSLDDASGKKLGSMFGDGSLSMLMSLAALAVSVAALGVAITSGKKKAAAKPQNEE